VLSALLLVRLEADEELTRDEEEAEAGGLERVAVMVVVETTLTAVEVRVGEDVEEVGAEPETGMDKE